MDRPRSRTGAKQSTDSTKEDSMTLRSFRPMLAASIVATLIAAGCGSSSSSSTSKSSTSKAASTSTATTKKRASSASSRASSATSSAKAKLREATAGKQYKAGQFCSSKNEKLYKAQSLACVNGHLKKT
jgi:hypothetical protein